MLQVDWASLPPELVEAIGEKLTVHADYIRFRAVCVPWRSCTLSIPKHLPCQFPWLMLSVADMVSSFRSFFDIAGNKIHRLNLPELSHPTRSYRICGSCEGWIVIVEKPPSRIFLFNPLTRERVDLPSFSSSPDASFDIDRVGIEYALRFSGDIDKIVLSGTPAASASFVAVIRQLGALAYCKRGENSWKYIEQAWSFTVDVTYLNGLFYAINDSGEIAVCDLGGDLPVVEFIHTPVPTRAPLIDGDFQYLVNSMGMLLLVRQLADYSTLSSSDSDETSYFRLFKLDFCQQRWEEMMSLEDRVLFLGDASSLALKASDFPGCKGNKIYFLDIDPDTQYCNALVDVGIFDLDDRSFHQLPCPLSNSDSSTLWPPPVWITPNPY